MLTVYGIETYEQSNSDDAMNVATVLTVYGIETPLSNAKVGEASYLVATVLTVYGIETQLHLQHRFYSICCNSAYRLRY